jgi:hypothetical protein
MVNPEDRETYLRVFSKSRTVRSFGAHAQGKRSDMDRAGVLA